MTFKAFGESLKNSIGKRRIVLSVEVLQNVSLETMTEVLDHFNHAQFTLELSRPKTD